MLKKNNKCIFKAKELCDEGKNNRFNLHMRLLNSMRLLCSQNQVLNLAIKDTNLYKYEL